MKPRNGAKNNRGTTLVEVLVAMTLMLLIFLFLTADLIQSSGAENLAANHTSTVSAANYLLGVMRNDNNFWGDWAGGPGLDPCGNGWPGYTDDITKPSWHPMCPSIFPEMAGTGVNFQFMWNAQLQGSPPDPNVAQLTAWVMSDEGGRHDIYELRTTRMQTAPQPSNAGIVPTGPPSPSPSPTSPPPSKSPTPTPSPKPSPSRTSTPRPSPTPTVTGIFE